MNLIIDFGNTRTKTAVFENGNLLDVKVLVEPMVCDLELIIRAHAAIKNCIVAASGNAPADIMEYLRNTFPKLVELTGHSHLPFKNNYESKTTQGSDRIAGIAGAQYLYPQTNVLVIDAGTAITFDFIDNDGNYLGGTISPGIAMRYKALHDYTSKLPLLEKSETFHLLGTNTNDAVISGVQNGIIFEIERYRKNIGELYPNLTTIMTGGDAEFFANKLKKTIFVDSNLVLTGLNRILDYNVH